VSCVEMISRVLFGTKILQGGSSSRYEVGSHSRAAVGPVGTSSVTLAGYLHLSRWSMFLVVGGVGLCRLMYPVLPAWSTVKLPPRVVVLLGAGVPSVKHIAEMVRR